MRVTFLKTAKERPIYFIVVSLIWAIYVVLTLIAPPAQATTRYGISLSQLNLLRLTILLPYLLIWIAILFSIIQYKKYSKIISSSPESGGFEQINRGLCMLFAQNIASPFIGLVANHYPNSFKIQKAVTILRNDLTIVFYLAAFYFFWNATKIFFKTLLNKKEVKLSTYGISLGFVAFFGTALVWFIVHNGFRTLSADSLIKPTYYLNDISIFITIVIPYLIIWLLGILTLLNLRDLSKNVGGIIYRKSFDAVAKGLAIIVGLTISLQFLTQATTYFRNAPLRIVLLLVYLIFFGLSAGYIYFARGATNLTKIEKA